MNFKIDLDMFQFKTRDEFELKVCSDLHSEFVIRKKIK